MDLVWSKDSGVSIDSIDAANQRLIKCIKALDDAICLEGQGGSGRREMLWHVLNKVADYADGLLHEEMLMEEANYPDLGIHKKKHELFTRRRRGHNNGTAGNTEALGTQSYQDGRPELCQVHLEEMTDKG